MKTLVIQSEVNGPISSSNQYVAPDNSGNQDPARSGSGIAAFTKRHTMVVFFVLAFALTWIAVPFGSFMAAGPLVAALIVTGLVDGRRGLRDLRSRMLRWRVRWYWYAAAILIPVGLALGTGAITVALGASGTAFANLELSGLVLLFAMRLVVPVFAPIGEEPGWRGFALPRLQAHRSPALATLILGIVVALWHVPLIFLASEDLSPILLLATVAVTFFYTWLFNHTGGSVFITIVAHAAEGLVGAAFLGKDGFHGTNETRFAVLYTAGWCVVAIAVVVFDRTMWRKPTRTPVAPSRVMHPSLAICLAVLAAGTVGVLGATAANARVTSSASKDAYIQKADAICDKTVKKTDRVVEEAGFSPTDAEARVRADKVVALGQAELVKLRALTPPARDAKRIAKIYAAMDAGWAQVDLHPSSLTDEPGPLAKATKLASAYGFEVCGRG
jgi:membrane protease YdiL (CAAX protease family)